MDGTLDLSGLAIADVCAEAGERAFGLARIGPALIAIPVEAVREATRATALSTLPLRAEGLRGAIDLRGEIIPVLDLRPALGLLVSEAPQAAIMILRAGGRLLGLSADAVCGMARIQAERACDLELVGGGAPLAVETFLFGGEAAVVLDPARIFSLTGVPTVRERDRGAAKARGAGALSLLTFRCGRAFFGIESAHVDATVPACEVVRNALTAGFCLGVIRHHGAEIPVVDTEAALGVGGGGAWTSGQVIVLRFPEGRLLAFTIDEARDIRRVPLSELVAPPRSARAGPRYFHALLPEKDGAQALILDMAAVTADPALTLLAGLSQRAPGRGTAEAAGASGGPRAMSGGARAEAAAGGARVEVDRQPHLVYLAGAEFATPLTYIREILPAPPNLAPPPGRGAGLLGAFSHRGRGTLVVCLARLLGLSPTAEPGAGRLLLVGDDEDQVGFVIDELRAIEHAQWRSHPADPAHASPTEALALIGTGPGARVLPRLDLRALHAELVGAA